MDAPTATVIAALITGVTGAGGLILVERIRAKPRPEQSPVPVKSEELPPPLLQIGRLCFSGSLFSFGVALALYVAGLMGWADPGYWMFMGLFWLVPAVLFFIWHKRREAKRRLPPQSN
jgi:hypothetical protein